MNRTIHLAIALVSTSLGACGSNKEVAEVIGSDRSVRIDLSTGTLTHEVSEFVRTESEIVSTSTKRTGSINTAKQQALSSLVKEALSENNCVLETRGPEDPGLLDGAAIVAYEFPPGEVAIDIKSAKNEADVFLRCEFKNDDKISALLKESTLLSEVFPSNSATRPLSPAEQKMWAGGH